VIHLSSLTLLALQVLYLFFDAYPIIFQEERGWSSGVGALPFLGLALGLFIGVPISIFTARIFRRASAASPTGKAPPEQRLYFAMARLHRSLQSCLAGYVFTLTSSFPHKGLVPPPSAVSVLDGLHLSDSHPLGGSHGTFHLACLGDWDRLANKASLSLSLAKFAGVPFGIGMLGMMTRFVPSSSISFPPMSDLLLTIFTFSDQCHGIVSRISPFLYQSPYPSSSTLIILSPLSSIPSLADTYTIYSASVFAANSLFRYIAGAVFPLFASYMFQGMTCDLFFLLPPVSLGNQPARKLSRAID
jgi:hypothetical protein